MLLEWLVLLSCNLRCNGTSVWERERERSVTVLDFWLRGRSDAGIPSKATGIFIAAHKRPCLKGQVPLSLIGFRTCPETTRPELCHTVPYWHFCVRCSDSLRLLSRYSVCNSLESRKNDYYCHCNWVSCSALFPQEVNAVRTKRNPLYVQTRIVVRSKQLPSL